MIAGNYEPIEWERVGNDGRGRWVSKRQNQRPLQKPETKRNESGELLGSVDYIRNLICTNREGVFLLISILLICDCDDSIEMLIALAVFLYPMLRN